MKTIDIDKLPPQAKIELIDFYEFLLKKHTSTNNQLNLGDLASKLFGNTAGVELDLPQHLPHDPLEFGQ